MKYKRIAGPLFFFCIVILSSCQKNKGSTVNNELSPVTLEVLKSSTIIGMRQAYKLLSIDEKETLWKEKLSLILENDGRKLSLKQISIIKEVQSLLLKNGMKKLHDNPAIGERFIKSRLDSYKQYFSEAELFMLIECPYFNSTFSIFDSKYQVSRLNNNERLQLGGTTDPTYVSPPPDCTCYYSISCTGSGNSCEEKKDKCVKVAECGLFGTSNCTGRCTNDVLPS